MKERTPVTAKNVGLYLLDFVIAFFITILIFMAAAASLTLMGKETNVFQIPIFVPALLAITLLLNRRRQKGKSVQRKPSA